MKLIAIIVTIVSLVLTPYRVIDEQECKAMINETVKELRLKYIGNEQDYFPIEKGFFYIINRQCLKRINVGLKKNFVKHVCIIYDKKSKRTKKITLDINLFSNEEQAISALSTMDSLRLKAKTDYSTCVDPKFLANQLSHRVGNIVIIFSNQYYDSTFFNDYFKDFIIVLNRKD